VFIRRFAECAELLAGDGTVLREYLHPDKQPLDLRYSLAHAALGPGERSLRHRLSVSEVYYILEGEGLMRIEGEEESVSAGDVVYIPPHATQCIHNAGDVVLRFLCIVDPAWRPQCEKVEGG
jgi:mannose-6-phosphate isomerase-like protein (cupin superfamily)